MTRLTDYLPEYPSVLHLPYRPNARGDKIATPEEASVIFSDPVSVQEKVDAANCGMAYVDGHPMLRSRSKVLRKGHTLKNASQKQFASAWNWMHARRKNFQRLGNYAVYGEWMVQQHGMYYDRLPAWFIAYDLWDWEEQKFLPFDEALARLNLAGFDTVPELFRGRLESYEQLERLANGASRYSTDQPREGLVVKTKSRRFKMVRQGFQQGCLLGDKIKKNTVANEE